jgi:hypothetical protein
MSGLFVLYPTFTNIYQHLQIFTDFLSGYQVEKSRSLPDFLQAEKQKLSVILDQEQVYSLGNFRYMELKNLRRG